MVWNEKNHLSHAGESAGWTVHAEVDEGGSPREGEKK